MNIEDELNKMTELTKELERSTNEHLKMACDGISGIENEEIKNYMRDSLAKAKNGTLDVITFASKVKELIKT